MNPAEKGGGMRPADGGRNNWRRACLLMFLAVVAALLAARRPSDAAEPPPAPLKAIEPPMIDGKPVQVAVELRITNVSDIDEVEEQYSLDAYLFADWRDPRLAYAAVAGAAARRFKFGEIWIPQLDIVNAVEPRHIYDRALIADPDGTVHMVERFNAVMSSKFYLRSFPFDTQRLLLVIHPFVAEAPEIVFRLRGSGDWISPDFNSYNSLAQWDVAPDDPSVTTVTPPSGHQISEISFKLKITRDYQFYLWKILLPLLLMVVLSWAVFWIETFDLQNQIQVAVLTLLTVIAFALAISSSLPKVPYLTFIDVYFLTCYIFVFIAILELMTVHVTHRVHGKDLGLRIRKVSRWVVPPAFCITIALFAWYFLG